MDSNAYKFLSRKKTNTYPFLLVVTTPSGYCLVCTIWSSDINQLAQSVQLESMAYKGIITFLTEEYEQKSVTSNSQSSVLFILCSMCFNYFPKVHKHWGSCFSILFGCRHKISSRFCYLIKCSPPFSEKSFKFVLMHVGHLASKLSNCRQTLSFLLKRTSVLLLFFTAAKINHGGGSKVFEW